MKYDDFLNEFNYEIFTENVLTIDSLDRRLTIGSLLARCISRNISQFVVGESVAQAAVAAKIGDNWESKDSRSVCEAIIANHPGLQTVSNKDNLGLPGVQWGSSQIFFRSHSKTLLDAVKFDDLQASMLERAKVSGIIVSLLSDCEPTVAHIQGYGTGF